MVNTLLLTAGSIVLLSLLIMLYRLVAGPTSADRAVAVDGMTIVTVSAIVLLAHFGGRSIYIDVALVYGLVSFLGIVALARFMDRGLS